MCARLEFGLVLAYNTLYYMIGGMIMRCSECNRDFAEDQLITFGDSVVCAECKPIFVQKLREGLTLAGEMVYGGFWIRVGAKIIDGIIITIVDVIIVFLSGLVMKQLTSIENESIVIVSVILQNVLVWVINLAYVTYFLGKYGATPGKMACGLKVVRPDGEKISYARACGRFLAEMLSAMILYIGYIMVAFDEEKRGLHDRICDTRVIKA
jgi:uncharacterized RDD family membrane protein YckC/DNA-directed RNA polymerase subunit RPC12/RpoP